MYGFGHRHLNVTDPLSNHFLVAQIATEKCLNFECCANRRLAYEDLVL